jgi:hypothetical protein
MLKALKLTLIGCSALLCGQQAYSAQGRSSRALKWAQRLALGSGIGAGVGFIAYQKYVAFEKEYYREYPLKYVHISHELGKRAGAQYWTNCSIQRGMRIDGIKNPLEQEPGVSTTIINGYSHPKGDVDLVGEKLIPHQKQHDARWWGLGAFLPTVYKATSDDGRTGVISAELNKSMLSSTFTPHATLQGLKSSLTVSKGYYGKGARVDYGVYDESGQLLYDHTIHALKTDQDTYKLEAYIAEDRSPADLPKSEDPSKLKTNHVLIEYPTSKRCREEFTQKYGSTNLDTRETYVRKCRTTPLHEMISPSASIVN